MAKKPTKKANRPRPAHIKGSKTKNFLKHIRENNSMIEYITKLRIMNPAAELRSTLNEPRREGGFVRLAHAREEFTAPILSKGKCVTPPEKVTKKPRQAKKKGKVSKKSGRK